MGRVDSEDLPTAVVKGLDVAVDDRRVAARPGQPFLIGRDPGCQLRVDDPKVSRRHAEVAWTEGGWVLRDLGSSNGTYLDGERVEPGGGGPGVGARLGAAAAGPQVRGGAGRAT